MGMELADNIEEVKMTCAFCNRKATMNLKSVDGAPTMDGPTVCLGAEEMYAPACYKHFCEKISSVTGGPIDFKAAWSAGDLADEGQREKQREFANSSKLKRASSASKSNPSEAPAALTE